MTYGKQHRAVAGAWWQELLRSLLPRELQARERVRVDDDRDTLIFWYSMHVGSGVRKKP